MRLSCCAYSYRDALQSGAMTLQQFLAACRANGLDGVELTSYYFPTTDREYLNELKLLAHKLGLAISGTAVGSDFAQPDADKRRAHVQMTLDWIERSVILGAPTLRVFAGPVQPGSTEEEAFATCVECLQECAAAAWQKGVMLALENHGGLTGTAASTLRILAAVGSPGIGLNLDLGNFQGDIYSQFADCAASAVAAHAKTCATIEPGRREHVDYDRVCNILKAEGYRGFLAIEYEEPEPVEIGLPQLLCALQGALRH